ncbi:type I site-specific deoxyribonuclease, HsdR family [Beutenbergia cavernae DSM 12333]|uniref:Type I restriction enzyme endonuclease subunit n=1 Tax=Beutenbergia cavernae (strain ATCC BAA-8 / DSM 12333 / CCUG 43141 / JCM 11478 / NBRC 16432 / NCIMB 13614 / HKI 0122) TaxID=471853 RepID=C5C4M4_BEUC1|nr:type I restriction endonuclease subunit R [Beutenbergia cavernae]ACQ82148.1 type I site-specific deoxyribonuclease, HsdR family [Beutenbergia cavernae DSM 12333]
MHPSEADWEQFALEELAEHGWTPREGKSIAPGAPAVVDDEGLAIAERETWADLLIPSRLKRAARKVNPDVPPAYLDQALATLTTPQSQDAIAENKRLHDAVVEGFRFTYLDDDGQERTPTIRLVDADPDRNEWLAVNQVTVVSGDVERRFDVVLYLNGMPVGIIELKNAGTPHADVAAAHAQLTTYVRELPLAFRFAVLTVASDGVTAKYGTPFTPLNHYSPWNVDDDGRVVGRSTAPGPEDSRATDGITADIPEGDAATGDAGALALEVLIAGLFNTERFLQLLRGYVAFDSGDGGLSKRIAKPHQYFAVSQAIATTIHAVETNGKAGVVWHTQGSGKSMEMELYANQVMRHPKLHNPTIVVVTDRTELDGQLYETFNRSELLPEKPRQIVRRNELRDELGSRVTGGIYFTTLQKFGLSKEEKDAGLAHPRLSDRPNIVVIVDEAHRSHYDDLDGYAWHLKNALPNATLIAFTGTPISFADRNTREVFGDVIHTYDLTRAVEDGATVPVYFESRLVKVGFSGDLTDDQINASADEVTVGLDETERDRIEKSVAVVNAIYGAPARLEKLATDLVAHWEARRTAMAELVRSVDVDGGDVAPGKALVVCATRDIAARLYEQIVAIRPGWHSADIHAGKVKVVYSGSATDQPPISDHVRRDSENAVIKKRLKDPTDELEIVIVKDMMLTGYDSPPLHTLYLDRPIRGALLMQTLARVNRTFRGKNAGLLVAYAPIAEHLTAALAEYTDRDQEAKPVGKTVDDAVDVARQLIEELRAVLVGFDWRADLRRRQSSGDKAAGLRTILAAVNWLRTPRRGDDATDGVTPSSTFRTLAGQLGRARAISGPEALADVDNEIRFYEEVRIWIGKLDAEERQARGEPIPDDVQRMLNELMAAAVESGEVLDIYGAAGLEAPRLDRLDTDYLTRAQSAENPQLTIEALQNLIARESQTVTHGNLVRQRVFSVRLSEVMAKYTNSNLTSAEVIAALIEVARDVSAEGDRGASFDPPLSTDELAFYDAVASNSSAVEVQGTGVLAEIARELVAVVRRDAKTDWTVRDDVRAKLRSSIRRLLVKHGYPPDQQPEAIKLVIEQMEAMAPRLAA